MHWNNKYLKLIASFLNDIRGLYPRGDHSNHTKNAWSYPIYLLYEFVLILAVAIIVLFVFFHFFDLYHFFFYYRTVTFNQQKVHILTLFMYSQYIPIKAVSCGKNPLVVYQTSGTELLLAHWGNVEEYAGQPRPFSARGGVSPNNSGVLGLGFRYTTTCITTNSRGYIYNFVFLL